MNTSLRPYFPTGPALQMARPPDAPGTLPRWTLAVRFGRSGGDELARLDIQEQLAADAQFFHVVQRVGLALQHAQEGVRHRRVELGPRAALQLRARPVVRVGLLVATAV